MKTEDVIFKGTKQGLCVILPYDDDFVRLKGKLAAKLESTSGFFAGATRAILDIGELALSEDDMRELVGIIESFGISVSRVVGGIGLSAIGRTLTSHGASGAPAGPPQPAPEVGQPALSEVARGDLSSPGQASSETLLVRRTLRSGQRVAFAGNVVVLGDVNAGAEVAAGGDIVVVGALRGVAHAGTPDNKRAIVVALRLTPTQLRIADF
ncbi:MAG: septum site-determining protein MinC, partial [Bacillota bacterium]